MLVGWLDFSHEDNQKKNKKIKAQTLKYGLSREKNGLPVCNPSVR